MTRPRALIAVAEERGIVEFVRCLSAAGYEVVVAGDTGRSLAMAGLDIVPVEFATRYAGLLGDRAEALHPTLLAGIIARRNNREDMDALQKRGLPVVDIVVAQVPGRAGHLSPRQSVADHLTGGPHGMRATLLQAAATNWEGVICICDPNDFDEVGAALGRGGLSVERRRGLAVKALRDVARYHSLLSAQFGLAGDDASEPAATDVAPPSGTTSAELGQAQPAKFSQALAADGGEGPASGLVAVVSGGEEMLVEAVGGALATRYEDARGLFASRGTYRKVAGGRTTLEALQDSDLGWSILGDLPAGQGAVLSRRGHICAIAHTPDSTARAILRALAGDPGAAKEGTIVVSGRVDLTSARALLDNAHGRGLATLAASAFDEAAVTALQEAGEMRLVELDLSRPGRTSRRLQPTRFGVLLLELAEPLADQLLLRQIGKVAQTAAMLPALRLAMSAARHAGCAAAAIAEADGTLAICAGQAHIRDAIQVAVAKARRFGRPGVLALNAPLDQPDVLAVLARANVIAVVQPGPAANEAEMGLAADAAKIALVAADGNWRCV